MHVSVSCNSCLTSSWCVSAADVFLCRLPALCFLWRWAILFDVLLKVLNKLFVMVKEDDFLCRRSVIISSRCEILVPVQDYFNSKSEIWTPNPFSSCLIISFLLLLSTINPLLVQVPGFSFFSLLQRIKYKHQN